MLWVDVGGGGEEGGRVKNPRAGGSGRGWARRSV